MHSLMVDLELLSCEVVDKGFDDKKGMKENAVKDLMRGHLLGLSRKGKLS